MTNANLAPADYEQINFKTKGVNKMQNGMIHKVGQIIFYAPEQTIGGMKNPEDCITEIEIVGAGTYTNAHIESNRYIEAYLTPMDISRLSNSRCFKSRKDAYLFLKWEAKQYIKQLDKFLDQ